MSKKTNRFFKKDDKKIDALGAFKIPPAWWSRGYEYAWAADKVKKSSVVMDAGCGIEHPFKWYLGDNCKEVYAVDADLRLLEFPAEEKIKWYCCDFTHAALSKLRVDDLFCISVLEHLKNPIEAVEMFREVLKAGGNLYLTIDYPLLMPAVLVNMLESNGFKIQGDTDFKESADDIVGPGNLRTYYIHAKKG